MAKDFIPNFTGLDRDIERYAERYCRKGEIIGTPAVFGHDEAVDTVFDAYLEAEAYDAVIHYLLTERSYEWGPNDKFLPVSALLHSNRHIGRLTRIQHAQGGALGEGDLPDRYPDLVGEIAGRAG